MGRGLFITATGTDVGKTYVTALIIKKLKEAGYHAGYYKAALSGADCIANSDAGYVKRISGIAQEDDTLLSYLYREAVSPHLAARIEGHAVELKKVTEDFKKVSREYDYVVVEGSGGIVCPIRWDESCKLLLEDIIHVLALDTLVVADAGLGTINAAVLTVEYLRQHGIGVKGVILNRYVGDIMQEDNARMIEELVQVPVLARVQSGDTELHMDAENLLNLFV